MARLVEGRRTGETLRTITRASGGLQRAMSAAARGSYGDAVKRSIDRTRFEYSHLLARGTCPATEYSFRNGTLTR